MMQVGVTLCLAFLMLVQGLAFCNGEKNTSGSAVSSTTSKNSSCGQVTNVYVQVGGDGVAGPQGEKGERGPAGGGVSFTRWGKTTCPSTENMELVYQGTTVGSAHTEAGSADYLCLHRQPELLRTTPGQQEWRGRLYSTAYEPYEPQHSPAFTNIFRHFAPCSVCYSSSRSTKITIPGRISCPSSWTKEYHGYLMGSDHHLPRGSRSPVCVDVNSESLTGTAGNARSLFYFFETTCIGIDCPPYANGAEVSCVVCTK